MKFRCLLYSLLLLLWGCGEDSNCLKSTGKIITEKRELSSFSTIQVNDNIDLILIPGTTQSVEIEAGKNMIDYITTEVVNYQLIIKNKNKCDWLRSYDKKIKVYVSQPALFEIYNLCYGKVSNTGQLVFDSLIIHNYGNGGLTMNIKCNKLNVDTNFLGDLTFYGEAEKVNVHCIRLAKLNTINLKCKDLNILSDAEGDVFVYAENSIKGRINSKGNIFYYGNPVVTNFEDLGEGNFIKQ